MDVAEIHPNMATNGGVLWWLTSDVVLSCGGHMTPVWQSHNKNGRQPI